MNVVARGTFIGKPNRRSTPCRYEETIFHSRRLPGISGPARGMPSFARPTDSCHSGLPTHRPPRLRISVPEGPEGSTQPQLSNRCKGQYSASDSKTCEPRGAASAIRRHSRPGGGADREPARLRPRWRAAGRPGRGAPTRGRLRGSQHALPDSPLNLLAPANRHGGDSPQEGGFRMGGATRSGC